MADTTTRVKITDDEFGGFRIKIPAARNWFLILFFSVWLCAWVVGEVMVLAEAVAAIFFGGRPMNGLPPLAVLCVWFPLWTVGGLMVMLALAWTLAGREVITLTDEALLLRREIGMLQRSRSFDLTGLTNLRYAPLVYNPLSFSFSFSESWGSQLQMLGLAGGAVAFDHGGKTCRFGNSLTEAEASRLIATIRQRHKFPDDRSVEPFPVSNGPP